MRIHTDAIQRGDLFSALPDGPFSLDVSDHGSRKRAKAFEAKLSYIGGKKKGDGRRQTNSGTYGATGELAATYDEWGEWIAKLYRIDPAAIIGPYSSREHFHERTEYKYASLEEASRV